MSIEGSELQRQTWYSFDVEKVDLTTGIAEAISVSKHNKYVKLASSNFQL